MDAMIQEPRTPFFNKTWHSFKFNGPAVRYEIATSNATGLVVHTNGPFPASTFTDYRIFLCNLHHKMLPNEYCHADKGYDDATKCVTPTKLMLDPLAYWQSSLYRARHETTNGEFKNFGVLSKQFRSSLDKHVVCFQACVVSVQVGALYERKGPQWQVPRVSLNPYV